MSEYLPLPAMTVEEYLLFEERATRRHEYVAGRVYAMAGATMRHNRIVGNLFARLWAAARGGPCQPYTESVKLRAGGDRIYYPDVLVLCGPHDLDGVLAAAPCLVAEVTSRSTRRTDHEEKRDAYLQLPMLQLYLVVEQALRQVTRYWRDGEGGWRSETITDDSAVVTIPCPELVLTLAELYAGIELPPARRHLRRVREGVPAGPGGADAAPDVGDVEDAEEA